MACPDHDGSDHHDFDHHESDHHDSARRITLELALSPGERSVLAAGGLLAHIRAGARPAVDLTRTP